jgi:hypothetical protein
MKIIVILQPLIPGLKSEVIMFDLIQRLVRLPNLLSDGSIVQFDITKDGQLASTWSEYKSILFIENKLIFNIIFNNQTKRFERIKCK